MVYFHTVLNDLEEHNIDETIREKYFIVQLEKMKRRG